MFSGVVEPNDDVRFKITEEDFYYDDLPGIIELLNPGVELQIGGFVSATASSTRIEGTLAGYIRVNSAPTAQLITCLGNSHRFVMQRPLYSVTGTGEATALRAGEVTITARYQSRTGTVPVLGLPAGTHKLTGMVTEEGRAIDGVSVSIISGVGSGLSTTTAGGGRFSFYGAAGRVSLQAKRDGYRNIIADVDVAATPTTHNLEIVPVRQRLNLSGTYTLTVTANCDFQTFKVPAPMNRRTYDATVDQQGPDLTLTVSGANLITSTEGRTRFEGSVERTGQRRVWFRLVLLVLLLLRAVQRYRARRASVFDDHHPHLWQRWRPRKFLLHRREPERHVHPARRKYTDFGLLLFRLPPVRDAAPLGNVFRIPACPGRAGDGVCRGACDPVRTPAIRLRKTSFPDDGESSHGKAHSTRATRRTDADRTGSRFVRFGLRQSHRPDATDSTHECRRRTYRRVRAGFDCARRVGATHGHRGEVRRLDGERHGDGILAVVVPGPLQCWRAAVPRRTAPAKPLSRRGIRVERGANPCSPSQRALTSYQGASPRSGGSSECFTEGDARCRRGAHRDEQLRWALRPLRCCRRGPCSGEQRRLRRCGARPHGRLDDER